MNGATISKTSQYLCSAWRRNWIFYAQRTTLCTQCMVVVHTWAPEMMRWRHGGMDMLQQQASHWSLLTQWSKRCSMISSSFTPSCARGAELQQRLQRPRISARRRTLSIQQFRCLAQSHQARRQDQAPCGARGGGHKWGQWWWLLLLPLLEK